jgi:hypothetical protein
MTRHEREVVKKLVNSLEFVLNGDMGDNDITRGAVREGYALLAAADGHHGCDTTKPFGMMFFREAGKDSNGKRIMAAAGVLGVPDEEVEGECQYVVTDMMIHKNTKADREKLERAMGCSPLGMTIGGLLTEPIWRT